MESTRAGCTVTRDPQWFRVYDSDADAAARFDALRTWFRFVQMWLRRQARLDGYDFASRFVGPK